MSETKDVVQNYYGKTLQSSADLKTDACCTADDLPAFAKPILAKVHDEVLSKYYGCGIVIPEQLKDCKILDLGSGSGRDCYVLSYLVGEKGEVVGVDMTDEQLEVANKHVNYMAETFNYSKPNVQFLKGDIEKLHELNLNEGSFDCVISNCVVNLAENKQAVLDGAFNLLKNGGEFYFSDVYADRRIPEPLTKDPILYGECLSGALYWRDFEEMAMKAGFSQPRLVTSRPLAIDDDAVEAKIGNIQFYSNTYRLFKLNALETTDEDYGQAVSYKGSIENSPNVFFLDDEHAFETKRMTRVSGGTFRMLKESRFSSHFEFVGDESVHFGGFMQDTMEAQTLTNPNVTAAQVTTTPAKTGGCC